MLKALIDRLLQGGVEELLQVLGAAATAAEAKDDAGALDGVAEHSVRKSAKTPATCWSHFGRPYQASVS